MPISLTSRAGGAVDDCGTAALTPRAQRRTDPMVTLFVVGAATVAYILLSGGGMDFTSRSRRY
ncbi:hypothetical protein GCM10009722_11320 [Williamsia deligens]